MFGLSTQPRAQCCHVARLGEAQGPAEMCFLPPGFCPRFPSSPACNLPAPCLHTTCMLPPLGLCTACTLPNLCVHFASSLPPPARYPHAACAPCRCLGLRRGRQRCSAASPGRLRAAKPCLSCRSRHLPRARCPQGYKCSWCRQRGSGSVGAVALPLPGSFSLNRSLRQPMGLQHPPLCPALPGGARAVGCGGPSLP